MPKLYSFMCLVLLVSSVISAYPDTKRRSECPKISTKETILLPHRDCRKFYICDHGQKVEMECERGLHFNPRFQICDYPESAGCSKTPAPSRGSPNKKLKCFWV